MVVVLWEQNNSKSLVRVGFQYLSVLALMLNPTGTNVYSFTKKNKCLKKFKFPNELKNQFDN